MYFGIQSTPHIPHGMLMQHGSHSLSHEALCIFLAKIAVTINARPFVPISTDPNSPLILNPTMSLPQKFEASPLPGTFFKSNLFRQQWKQVQSLADNFWYRWRECLLTLQTHRKWNATQPDIQEGDLVLLRDSGSSEQMAHGACLQGLSYCRWKDTQNWRKGHQRRIK